MAGFNLRLFYVGFTIIVLYCIIITTLVRRRRNGHFWHASNKGLTTPKCHTKKFHGWWRWWSSRLRSLCVLRKLNLCIPLATSTSPKCFVDRRVHHVIIATGSPVTWRRQEGKYARGGSYCRDLWRRSTHGTSFRDLSTWCRGGKELGILDMKF